MDMEDFADFVVDNIEEPNSCVPLQSNVDLLLADVTEVQKILNSNNVGDRVDVNEIFEKLEELTYIVREERIEYVATQFLYKYGVITDKNGQQAFNFRIDLIGNGNSGNLNPSHERPSASNVNDSLTLETCIPSVQNGIAAGINTTDFQNDPHVHTIRTEDFGDGCEIIQDFEDTSPGPLYSAIHEHNMEETDRGQEANQVIAAEEESAEKMFSDFVVGYESGNYLQDEACAIVKDNVNVLEPSVCAVNNTNEGLNNFVLVGVAEDNDKSQSNSTQMFGEELMQEAKFLSEMFPHFELEQILEFLNVNRDVENRVEVVSDEILKMHNTMLQEITELSELIEIKNKGKCNDDKQEQKDPEVSQEPSDLASERFAQEDTNINCVAENVTNVKCENEKLLKKCESAVVSDVEINLIEFNEVEPLIMQECSSTDKQGWENSDIANPETTCEAGPLSSQLSTPVPYETTPLTSELLNVYEVRLQILQSVLSTVSELENAIFPSNSQSNGILQQEMPPTPQLLSDIVPSTSKVASSHHVVTQPNIPDRIEHTGSLSVDTVSLLDSAVHEIKQPTSDTVNVSYELVHTVSEPASPQPKASVPIPEVNSSVHEIKQPNNSKENSSEIASSVSKPVTPQLGERSSDSQLNDELREMKEPTSDVPNVSCGLIPIPSKLTSSSQLNSALQEVSDTLSTEPENTPPETNSLTSQVAETLKAIQTSSTVSNAQPSSSQLVNQGCRKKEITYEEFVSSLPHVDIVLLKDVWAQIGNNYGALKEFMNQQMEDVPDDTQYHLLLSMFPQADPKFLKETSMMIGTDDAALKAFIDEQLQEDESKGRYHMLLAMFPKVESAFLQAKCIEVGNNDDAMRNLVMELLNMNDSDDNYHTLLAMFPESDPAFLREKAEKIGNDSEAMKKFVTDYLEDVESVQFRTLVAVLPDADPEYLQKTYEDLGRNEESIKLFIMEALENRNYPTRESYLKRQEIATLKRKYKEELNIQEFLDVIPDPWTYFRNKNTSNERERRHALAYLESRFKTIALDQIDSCFQKCKYNLTLTCEQLDKWQGPFQQTREMFQHTISDTEDIPVPFLQEVAFIENKTKMEEFLERKKQQKKEAFELAKANGELLECQCCFDNELLDLDVSTCNEGHIFCKECIKRSAEVGIGSGNTHFLCLAECTAEFPLRIIQTVLNPTTFSRMLQRRQLEEVQAAGIQDLESCPFCDFATIPATSNKVFSCLNPECMRDSCRKCKRPSHIPLRCDEVESKEIKVRTMIEDRMTDALVRTCWQCKKKFIKESGCNKMRCGCGAAMCYLCRQPVKDYTHFNGQGGTEFHKCPLYSDLQIIHDVAVQEEGIKAKREVQEQNPDVELKHDPTIIKPFSK